MAGRFHPPLRNAACGSLIAGATAPGWPTMGATCWEEGAEAWGAEGSGWGVGSAARNGLAAGAGSGLGSG
jgi:hypothetical protein